MIFKNSIAVYLKLNANLLRIHSPLSIHGDIQTHDLPIQTHDLFSFCFIATQAQENVYSAARHNSVSWASGLSVKPDVSKIQNNLYIYRDALSVNEYFLIQTSNNFEIQFFSLCFNPNVITFRQQSQFQDSQINVLK